MTISSTQQGIVSQLEFAKLLMLGSLGALEAAAPLTDDEGRDFEIHRKDDFDRGIAFQVKSSKNLVGPMNQKLSITFNVRNVHLISHPRYWYFFAYLDLRRKAFGDPVFLIPSALVHRHGGSPGKDVTEFSFKASMSPESRDRWVPYRVSTFEVGRKVLEIIGRVPRRLQASGPPTRLAELPELVWATRRRAA